MGSVTFGFCDSAKFLNTSWASHVSQSATTIIGKSASGENAGVHGRDQVQPLAGNGDPHLNLKL
jgi:hypothetical protein